MQRGLTLLLLLISLAGTFFPCCLADGCNEAEAATTQTEKKKQPEGACSPFFGCATCSGFTQRTKPIEIGQPSIENPVHHSTPIQFHLSTYASSPWQPPRSC